MWHELWFFFGSMAALGNMAARVLVIDDVADILVLATLSLEACGFVALTAHDGVEGVELASRSWPDLILCDVHMPKLDGFGVLSALRANAATAQIPVIFITGDESVPDRVTELTLQPDACLTKPFSHADLMRTVTATLPWEDPGS
jgi:CheY-like chemotaxis protein